MPTREVKEATADLIFTLWGDDSRIDEKTLNIIAAKFQALVDACHPRPEVKQ